MGNGNTRAKHTRPNVNALGRLAYKNVRGPGVHLSGGIDLRLQCVGLFLELVVDVLVRIDWCSEHSAFYSMSRVAFSGVKCHRLSQTINVDSLQRSRTVPV